MRRLGLLGAPLRSNDTVADESTEDVVYEAPDEDSDKEEANGHGQVFDFSGPQEVLEPEKVDSMPQSKPCEPKTSSFKVHRDNEPSEVPVITKSEDGPPKAEEQSHVARSEFKPPQTSVESEQQTSETPEVHPTPIPNRAVKAPAGKEEIPTPEARVPEKAKLQLPFKLVSADAFVDVLKHQLVIVSNIAAFVENIALRRPAS